MIRLWQVIEGVINGVLRTISVTDNSDAALTITQSGTAEALKLVGGKIEVGVQEGMKLTGYNTLLTMTSSQIRLLTHGNDDLKLGAINLDWNRDLKAAGGFKQGYCFMQSNVPASQSAVALDVLGLTGNTEIVVPYAGSVMGISIASNAPRTAGTLTVDATVNGTATGLQAVLDATNTQYHQTTQAKDTDAFSEGDRLGVKITTDANWAPETADIVVTVIVEM